MKNYNIIVLVWLLVLVCTHQTYSIIQVVINLIINIFSTVVSKIYETMNIMTSNGKIK